MNLPVIISFRVTVAYQSLYLQHTKSGESKKKAALSEKCCQFLESMEANDSMQDLLHMLKISQKVELFFELA